MSVAAIVLAAGASRRLGRPKQNVLLGGETLLERAVRVARGAGLAPIVVVVREGTEHERDRSPDVIVEINPKADEGIASSIRCGVAAASNRGVAGAVILTCDQPALRSEHLAALVKDEQQVTASSYGGSIGVPAYFPARLFASLSHLTGDTGARRLLKDARTIEAEELELDIDTERDLEQARRQFTPLQMPD